MPHHPDSLKRHGWEKDEWHLVTDIAGRPLGKFKTLSQPLRDDIEVIRRFLITIQKDRKVEDKTMSKTEQTNMVWIAGTLKTDVQSYDNNTRCLVDVGMKSAIPCTVYTGDSAKQGNGDLAAKLKRFKAGDFIRIVAFLRPYGVKNEEAGTWKNSISIDITEIKNDPPKRSQQSPRDGDIPF